MHLESFCVQEKTLGSLLDEIIARHPDNDAVIYFDRNLRQTWAQFGRDVDRLAMGLMALGIGKGDKIGVWATNVPHWITLMFASARIGAVLITVNTNYQDHELEYLLRQSDCETLFMTGAYRDHDFFQILYSVLPEVKTQEKGNIRSKSLPRFRRVVHFGSEDVDGIYSMPEIMALGDTVPLESYEALKADIDPHDVVNMQYTSGTTGFPKGVMLTHVNILNNGYWIGKHQNLGPKDRVCLPVPLFHCFGCVLGVMAFVNHGATMVVIDVFNPLQVLAAVQKERCTGLYGVPTMFLSVLEHKHFSRYDLSTLRTGIMAGSVCPAPLMRRAVTDMSLSELTICYGLTEGSPVISQTTTDDDFEHKTTTVGRPMPGIEVKIVRPGTQEELPRGEPGEVISRGYNTMKGYYNMPEATRDVIDAEGWLHTGDLGVMQPDGYLVITGRIKDMIIRGGENIFPKEIEEFLSGMDGIMDVQVVSVPSYKYGEEVAAFIIPREGATITPKDIRAFCRGKIAWNKVPRHIAMVPSFPMTGSGKIQKFKLREMALELFSDKALGQE